VYILITIVLVQRGRGGGFVDNLSGLESMFGTRTSVFLTRATTVSAVVFFITCLLLAVMSAHRSKSLLEGYRPVTTGNKSGTAAGGAATAPQEAGAQKAPAAVEPAPIAPSAVQETTPVSVGEAPAATQTPIQEPTQKDVFDTRGAPKPRQGELK